VLYKSPYQNGVLEQSLSLTSFLKRYSSACLPLIGHAYLHTTYILLSSTFALISEMVIAQSFRQIAILLSSTSPHDPFHSINKAVVAGELHIS